MILPILIQEIIQHRTHFSATVFSAQHQAKADVVSSRHQRQAKADVVSSRHQCQAKADVVSSRHQQQAIGGRSLEYQNLHLYFLIICIVLFNYLVRKVPRLDYQCN